MYIAVSKSNGQQKYIKIIIIIIMTNKIQVVIKKYFSLLRTCSFKYQGNVLKYVYNAEKSIYLIIVNTLFKCKIK